jgi:signal transduction histidine kinase
MPDKGTEQLRQELAAERERLGTAVDDLRTEVDELKRKLPYAAGAVIAAGLLAELVRRRFFR